MNTVFLQPPALNGDERSQLQQLYRYLFRLSEQLNASLEATDSRYAQVVKTRSGTDSSIDVMAQAEDQQYRELRSLIVKTADIVNQKMDKIVRQLSSDFQAISDEWGTFQQNIERTIIETAENTIEQFDYSEHIVGIDKETSGGVTEYRISSLGYIKRGIIGFDDDNMPIYGIAVGTQLEEKSVEKDGVEYSVIDTTQNLATYTSDRISFWINGVERAYFSADTLYVRRIKVIDGITIGDWSIDVDDGSGLTIGQKIGNSIDINQNEAMEKANRRIALVVDGASTDTQLVLTDQILEAIAENVNLQANESIRLIVSDKVSKDEYYGVKTGEGAVVHADGLLAGQGIHVLSSFGPARSGSGEPAPDNILPISGRTGATLTRCGKNLLPNAAATNTSNGVTFTVNGDGSVTINGTATAMASLRLAGGYNDTDAVFRYRAGEVYAMSMNASGYGSFAMYSRQTGEWKSVIQLNSASGLFRPEEDGYITDILLYIPAGTTVNNATVYPQIEVGAAATAYEPYAGDVYTLDFGQTVYGGTLDWNTGELLIDRGCRSFTGDEGWAAYGSQYPHLFVLSAADWNALGSETYEAVPVMNSHYPFDGGSLTGGENGTRFNTYANPATRYYISDSRYTDVASFTDYLAAQYAAGTPVQVCYMLAEPVSVQLRPVQPDALAGMNTVYTDLDWNEAEFGHESLTGMGAASDYDLQALTNRVSTAEMKITKDAIVSTVTSSTEYKTLSGNVTNAQSTADAANANAAAAQSTADTAKGNAAAAQSAADAAQSAADGNAADISALVTRVASAEQKITADAIVSTVRTSSAYTADLAGKASVNDVTAAQNSADAAQSAADGNAADISALTTRVVNAESKIEQKADSIQLSVLRAEVEGLSEEVKEPAKALVTGTTVTITDELFDVQTEKATFSIIDNSTGEIEETLRIDEDGLTAQEATFGTVHSDSVVLTQEAVSFTPANAGELQAFFDNLSNRFLLGDVTVDASALTGGEFRVSGIHGNGVLIITGGTLNAVALMHCQAVVRLEETALSTSGTAVMATTSRVGMNGCTIDAAKGLVLDGQSDVLLAGCGGTCTTLADVLSGSVLRISGDSAPYGLLGSVSGEIYSEVEFAEAPSAVVTPTVMSASLPATTTKTWNGSWLSGNALYQGKTTSDSYLRRGCMWFDTSAISGKTIVSATLTMKRYSGIGGGGSIAVGVYGTTTASASGTPAVGTKYASVSFANGATKAVDVTAAVQALANGNIKGLIVYDTVTDTFGSKNYTYGYCKLYGSDESAKPVLNVVYK